MMDRRRFLRGGATLAAAGLIPAPSLGGPASLWARRPHSPFLGIHLDQVPQGGLGQLEAVERAVGRVQVVSWYQAWGGDSQFHPEWVDLIQGSGRVPMLTWEPWAYDPLDTSRSCEAITAGLWDDYLTQWATALAARQGPPVYIRFAHEMNGGAWYPWNGSEVYTAAWRHVVDLFDRVGAGGQVKWVWCPLVDDISRPFEDYWPGARYVDVLGLDGYNWGATSYGWRDPEAVFLSAYQRVAALGPQPVWLCEVGCAPEGGNKPAWITSLYQLCASDMRRVKAVVWFSLDKEQDWRIEADPEVSKAVKERP